MFNLLYLDIPTIKTFTKEIHSSTPTETLKCTGFTQNTITWMNILFSEDQIRIAFKFDILL